MRREPFHRAAHGSALRGALPTNEYDNNIPVRYVPTYLTGTIANCSLLIANCYLAVTYTISALLYVEPSFPLNARTMKPYFVPVVRTDAV